MGKFQSEKWKVKVETAIRRSESGLSTAHPSKLVRLPSTLFYAG